MARSVKEMVDDRSGGGFQRWHTVNGGGTLHVLGCVGSGGSTLSGLVVDGGVEEESRGCRRSWRLVALGLPRDMLVTALHCLLPRV